MFHQSDANEGSTNTAHKGAFCLDFIQRLFVIFIFLLEMVIVYLLTFHPNVARLSFGRKIVKHSIKLTWFEKVSIPWVIARRYSFKIHLCAALNNINPKKSPTTNQGTIQASGAKYLGFFSDRSLKMREKYISFAQFVYFLREVCLLFHCWMIKFIITSK